MSGKLNINFATGEVIVNDNGTDLSINTRVKSSTSVVTYKQLSLLDIQVSLKAQMIDGQLNICLFPLEGTKPGEMDQEALNIAKAIHSISPQPILPQCHATFPWGEILLRTEWRDGGWGADIQYI